eukprot:1992983-Amphidinium_carterae.1
MATDSASVPVVPGMDACHCKCCQVVRLVSRTSVPLRAMSLQICGWYQLLGLLLRHSDTNCSSPLSLCANCSRHGCMPLQVLSSCQVFAHGDKEAEILQKFKDLYPDGSCAESDLSPEEKLLKRMTAGEANFDINEGSWDARFWSKLPSHPMVQRLPMSRILDGLVSVGHWLLTSGSRGMLK